MCDVLTLCFGFIAQFSVRSVHGLANIFLTGLPAYITDNFSVSPKQQQRAEITSQQQTAPHSSTTSNVEKDNLSPVRALAATNISPVFPKPQTVALNKDTLTAQQNSKQDATLAQSNHQKEHIPTPMIPVVPVLPPSRKASLVKPETKSDTSTENRASVSRSPTTATAVSKVDVEPSAKVSLVVERNDRSTESLSDATKEEQQSDKGQDGADSNGAASNLPAIPVVNTVTKVKKPTSTSVNDAKEKTTQSHNTLAERMPETETKTSSPKSMKHEDSVKVEPLGQPEPKRPVLRTLQITSEMIAQSEAHAPTSAATEKSASLSIAAHNRHISRQASVSVSRPSTPAASERLASRDVSRASSPPLSLVGSAPVKSKTKSQAKKDRKNKAEELSEPVPDVAAPVTLAQQNVAPIVARQKKQKKAKSSTKTANTFKLAKDDAASVSTENIQNQSEQPEDNQLITAGSTLVLPDDSFTTSQQQDISHVSSPTVDNEPAESRPPYTLRDFLNAAAEPSTLHTDAGARREDTHRLLTGNMSSMRQILNEMIENKEIAKDHPLLNPPPFSSSAYKLTPDQRKGQAYLDGNGYTSSDAFGMVYLPNKEKKALYNGHAVSVADSGDRADDILKRCLITPSGWVLRHLSRDESEKVLDLEERRASYAELYGDLGFMDDLGRLEEDDYCNLEGGFEELSRRGEAHGICWIISDDTATRRYASGHRDSHGLDDDYGLGDMPVDLESDDQFDDLDEEDDEEELNGEQMVLGADMNYDDDFYDEGLDDNYTFAQPPTQPIASLPPLPDMSGITGWENAYNVPFPTRPEPHGMYSSLTSPNAMPYRARATDMNPPSMLPPPSQLAQASRPAVPPMHRNLARDIFTLRSMEIEQLEKTIKERGREVEASRKEIEKVDKQLNKKNKDMAKTREHLRG